MKRVKYFYPHKDGKLSHHSTVTSLIVAFSLVPVLLAVYLLWSFGAGAIIHTLAQVPYTTLVLATAATSARILVAYVLSFVAAFGLALLVTVNKNLNRILLPIYDVLESIPVLAFFPIIITFFIAHHMSEWAAILVIFFAILWNLVFTMVGGIQIIPNEIQASAKLYGIKGFLYVRHILLPAIMPEIVTGSILAIAAAWDIVIVAEVLHTYLPNGDTSMDLFGLGSLFVNASVANDQLMFMSSLFFMILIITVTNVLIWQRLLRYVEVFRFE